jgi:hypothetical protein
LTITEGLAEIKTANKRIEKKVEFITQHLWRPDTLKDPLEKQGGSVSLVRNERQAIHDLHDRTIKIRSSIADINAKTKLTINGITRSIEEWLVWRRDVVPTYRQMLTAIRASLQQAHQAQMRQHLVNRNIEVEKAADVVVNIDEQEFAKEVELLEDTLGQLDGQLSMKNATIQLPL